MGRQESQAGFRLFFEPSLHDRIFKDDRLITFGTGRNKADLDADRPRKILDIFSSFLRKVAELCHANRGTLPARQRLIDRFDLSKIVRNRRKRIDPYSVNAITDTNLNLIKLIQNIKFS